MSNDNRKLSITYSSGLIPPPEHMSTLAVFYDEIWLPQPYDVDVDNIRTLNEQYDLFTKMAGPKLKHSLKLAQKEYSCLKEVWALLFDVALLQTMSPISLAELERIIFPISFPLPYFNDKCISNRLREVSFDFINPILIGIHRFRNDKTNTELYFSNPSDTHTERLSGFLVHSLFQYKVPHLQALNSEQILEIRDYIKDTKEGFTYYINQMTDDVEQRIKSGDLTEMEAAQKTLERKILPLYEEFRRQLAAKNTGFWSRVAMAGGKFMQVDATPLSIRFLGAVLELCGISLDELSKYEQENFLSNKSQAFNYIATLESAVSKRIP